MEKRSFFRVICYAMITLALIGGGFLLGVGIAGVIDERAFSEYYIVIGVALPIVVFMTVYPLLTLVNIDEKVERLTEQIEKLVEIRLDERIVSDADDCEDEIPQEDVIVK